MNAPGRRAIGFFLSFIVPGAGHALLGRWQRGVVFTAMLFAAWISIPVTRVVGMGAMLLFFLGGAIDVLFVGARVRPAFGRLALIWAALFVGYFSVRAAFRTRYLATFNMTNGAVAMRPTLLPGDNVFVAAYRRRPTHGDVIAYHPAHDDHDTWMHRVIGVAGDQLVIGPHGVVVNGIEAVTTELPRCEYSTGTCSEERWGGVRRHLIEREPGANATAPTVRVVVPPGHVFVMGDNRDNSLDSRRQGAVPLDRVVGTLLFVWWSTTRSPTQVEYRWERFGLQVR